MGRNRSRVLSFIAHFSAPAARDSKTATTAATSAAAAAPVSSLQQNYNNNNNNTSSNHNDSNKSPKHNSNSPSGLGFHRPKLKPDLDPDTSSTPSPAPPPARDATSDSAPSTSATTSRDSEHAASAQSSVIPNSSSSSPAAKPKRSSRPLSLVQTYQPPLMDINSDTPPELQPIFSLLNGHANKLYQEGYFLKLDDQDIRGNLNPDRTWTECFAQLVGTVLSLWDAAELDAAGEDGEVLPKFINLTDASIKMIESLPTKSNDEQPLQNILSISTAGRNRYLLHFNSHHSLIQWTSGIRLAMYEHATLQEAYTGSLVAGKGKTLNSINIIMERARQPISEWVRVRFGAGVPWKRCYCVIEPPSEKEYQKAQKEWKKKNPYDRSHGPILKGQIKFFESKKDAEKKKKHQRPIASITDAYSAYAIYPQAKALIDGSTLLKIEGDITIHSEPPSTTEGFVFIMPETHPAVPGFEMLLRFLFPTWDTFGLYGRPGRLVASVLDPRSLMFGMPKHKRHGYLELSDVSNLIMTEGSSSWSEREWRKRLKELTGQRMAAMEDAANSAPQSRSASRNGKRLSGGAGSSGSSRPRVGFADEAGPVQPGRSQSVPRHGGRNESVPPDPNREPLPAGPDGPYGQPPYPDRQVNEPQYHPYGQENGQPAALPMRLPERVRQPFTSDLASTPERLSDEEEDSPIRTAPAERIEMMQPVHNLGPVNPPPAFSHNTPSRPSLPQPYHTAEMRRRTQRLSHTTLSQLAKASGIDPAAFKDDDLLNDYQEESAGSAQRRTDQRNPAVQTQTSTDAVGMNANLCGSPEVLTSANPHAARASPGSSSASMEPDRNPSSSGAQDVAGNPPSVGAHGGSSSDNRSLTSAGRRTPGPESQSPQSPPSGPTNRNPLPTRSTSLAHSQDDVTPASRSPPQTFPFQSSDSSPPPIPPQHPLRQATLRAVVYDDASSTTSPDYASTRRSSITEESVEQERPRAGVLKTVGTDPAVLSKKSNGVDSDFDIPKIDFGPTLNYAALPVNKIPPNGSSSRAGHATGRKSPGPAAAYSHNRSESSDTIRRSVVWQPGTAVGTSDGGNTLSPEQFVEQRAAAAVHQYAHHRSSSTGTLLDVRPTTPSSPYGRPTSRGPSHSRHSSIDLLSTGRPGSQGTAMALSGGELSSHLSAREQEHVARITGTPLIALAGNKGPSPTQNGLVGAIEKREREKAQIKDGICNQAVIQAIDQRQREQQQQAQRAAQAAYAQQQAQYTAQQYAYASGQKTPAGMSGVGPGPMYLPNMPAAMVPRSMSPGPGVGMGPGARSPPPMIPQQQMPYAGHFQGGYGPPSGGSGWTMPMVNNNMGRSVRSPPPGPIRSPPPGPVSPAMMSPGPIPPSPSFAGSGHGVRPSSRPQTPNGLRMPPPPGQYGVAGGPRPGTPGRMMPYQGQAF